MACPDRSTTTNYDLHGIPIWIESAKSYMPRITTLARHRSFYTHGVKQIGRSTEAAWWVILGAGGHARSVVDAIEKAGGRILVVAGEPRGLWPNGTQFVDDDSQAVQSAFGEGCSVALGIGGNATRARVYGEVRQASADLSPVLASTATIGRSTSVGSGTVILEHAHVGPAATVGIGVILNTAAVVEHDCHIGDFAHIAPGATVLGGARVGRLSFVGAGAIVLPGVEVGDDCVVGAGAVVTKNVESRTTVLGVPAKPVPRTPAPGEV